MGAKSDRRDDGLRRQPGRKHQILPKRTLV
jgi:hypothetical protein